MVSFAKVALLYTSIVMAPATTVYAPFHQHVEQENIVQHERATESVEKRKAALHTLVEVENKFFTNSIRTRNKTLRGILILDASHESTPTTAPTRRK